MASFNQFPQIALILLMGLLSVVHGRPCKSFSISFSYSVLTQTDDFTPSFQYLNPSLFYSDSDSYRSSGFFMYRREFNQFDLTAIQLPENPRVIPSEESKIRVFGTTNSLVERTKDIFSIVVGLMFGMLCGALMSAALYLMCYFVVRRSDCYKEESDEYVKIPDSPVKVKEGYEGN